MSYDTFERSRENGRPIQLYQFQLDSTIWRFTSANRDLTVNGHEWAAVAISDEGMSQSGEATSDTLSIHAPSTIGPAQSFMSLPPIAPIQVAIYRKHVDDAEAVVVYMGEITQVDFNEPGSVTFICMTLSASMNREGVRLVFQRTCPYALYDPLTCKVNKASYEQAMVVQSINPDGSIVMDTVGGHAAPYFSGGMLQWTDAMRGAQSRTIESQQSGTTLVIFGSIEGLVPGLAVKAYPGCQRTVDACLAFSNILNYGGCPAMPGKSPFDGDPVF